MWRDKMYYITTKQYRKPRQLSWEDVIFDKIIMNDFTNDNSNSTATITRKYEHIDDAILQKIKVEEMIDWLYRFNEQSKELFNVESMDELYQTFRIPKKTGGFRRIDAPCAELQNQLQKLANFITDDCGVLYHTSAFAYVPGRCIVDCLTKHKKNESKWFLKTDFSGFFPNTTIDFAMNMLSMVFPLSEICKRTDGYNQLRKAISLGFLNGGLPQGTVLSPMLTNCFMIPIDHALFNKLAEKKLVYTRYADDIHISGQEKFPYKKIVTLIEETLKEFSAPYIIKDEKTHFGSRNGKNWNLGLMLNKDNEITVGWKKKQYFKAALCSFILDTKSKHYWTFEDVQHLRGQLSYYMMVEKDYFNKIVKQQESKWEVNISDMFKMYFSGTI